MAGDELRQANEFLGNASPGFIPYPQHSRAPPNAGVLPAADNDRLGGHRGDIRPPVGGVADPERLQDPHRINVAYYGMADYYPQPALVDLYEFPYAGLAQGIPAGIPGYMQPNAPENQGHAPFDYAPQQFPPGPPQAAFPHPIPHQIPAPGQPAAENLRRFASRYLYHPNSQVDMVRVEPGGAGRCKSNS